MIFVDISVGFGLKYFQSCIILNSNLKLNLYFQDRPRVGKVAVVPGQIYPGRGHRGHHRLQQLAQIRYILSINDVTNFLATFLTPFLPNPYFTTFFTSLRRNVIVFKSCGELFPCTFEPAPSCNL